MSYFEVQNITVAFGGVKALNDISFSVNQGEIFTIIGPNGAGKSTLFNVISRIYEPNIGEIHFNNQNISKSKPHQMASLGIARTFQNLELFENSTVLQNLLLGRHIYRKSNLINELFFTEDTYCSYCDASIQAAKILNWNNEQAKLLAVYNQH